MGRTRGYGQGRRYLSLGKRFSVRVLTTIENVIENHSGMTSRATTDISSTSSPLKCTGRHGHVIHVTSCLISHKVTQQRPFLPLPSRCSMVRPNNVQGPTSALTDFLRVGFHLLSSIPLLNLSRKLVSPQPQLPVVLGRRTDLRRARATPTHRWGPMVFETPRLV